MDRQTDQHVYQVNVYEPSTVCKCGKPSWHPTHIKGKTFIRGVARPKDLKEDK